MLIYDVNLVQAEMGRSSALGNWFFPLAKEEYSSGAEKGP